MNYWASGLGHEQFKEKPHAFFGREIVKEMGAFTKDSVLPTLLFLIPRYTVIRYTIPIGRFEVNLAL